VFIDGDINFAFSVIVIVILLFSLMVNLLHIEACDKLVVCKLFSSRESFVDMLARRAITGFS